MSAELENTVQYYLDIDGEKIHLNSFLGKEINLEYAGEINCIKCGRLTKKSFSQGFCYPCFVSVPETEECVLRPELCRAHEGIARDMDYAEKHCLIGHFVYLSLTSNIKVGVTRNTQIPTRWIDQGAVQAIILAYTPNRYIAGLIETSLKSHLADKTNWRNMLTGRITDDRSLTEVKQLVPPLLSDELSQYITDDNEITHITYPLTEKPMKVNSLNFDKDSHVKGTLTGIKGQYLILDNRNVLNIRKFGGYKVRFSG